MAQEHTYEVTTVWNGNKGSGTRTVRSYSRDHTTSIPGKPDLQLTTDNPAAGDKSKLNPEDLLVTALSSCHMLSYLYVCALEGVEITRYTDNARGIMVDYGDEGGHFKEVTLNPQVVVSSPEMIEKAIALHHKAHEICYIARSVNFEVKCNPTCRSL